MLKSLRFSAALIAVVATQIGTAFLASPPTASAANVPTLNAQLKQSICTQNWGEAVKVIDQMIAITPSSNQKQYNELQTSRARMQNLSVSRTNVDSWLKSYCATLFITPAVANNSNLIYLGNISENLPTYLSASSVHRVQNSRWEYAIANKAYIGFYITDCNSKDVMITSLAFLNELGEVQYEDTIVPQDREWKTPGIDIQGNLGLVLKKSVDTVCQ